MNSTENHSDAVQTPDGKQFNFLNCHDYRSLKASMLVMMVDFIFGMLANGWSLWLISSGGRSLIKSEIFIEMLNCVFFIVSTANIFLLRNESIQLSTHFLYGMGLAGRPLFQCCNCVERYLAVVHPVIYLKYKSLRYSMGCCGVVWLLVLGFGAINYLQLTVINTLCLFLLILSVDLFCSLSILRVLKKPGPGDGGKEKKGGNLQKKRAFRIVSITLVMLVVNYGPTIIMGPLQSLFVFNVFVCEITPPIVTIAFLGSSVQALLFLRRAGKLTCLCATRDQKE